MMSSLHKLFSMSTSPGTQRQLKNRILIVTSELKGIDGMGGISSSTPNMIWALKALNKTVEVFYASFPWCVKPANGTCNFDQAVQEYGRLGVPLHIGVLPSDPTRGAVNGLGLLRDAWKLHTWLEPRQTDFDLVLFHDYRAVGFYAASAKRLGTAYRHLPFALYLHGTMQVLRDANPKKNVANLGLMLQFHLERFVVENADILVSPSKYLAAAYRDMYNVHSPHVICPIPMLDSPQAALDFVTSPLFLDATPRPRALWETPPSIRSLLLLKSRKQSQRQLWA
jgi:hypothetical protein